MTGAVSQWTTAFAAALRYHRAEQNLTKADLQRMSTVNASTITAIENGGGGASISTAGLLADALGQPLWAMLTPQDLTEQGITPVLLRETGTQAGVPSPAPAGLGLNAASRQPGPAAAALGARAAQGTVLSSPSSRRAPGGEEGTAPTPPGDGRVTVPSPGGTSRQWTVTLPAGLPLLNLNDRMHWAHAYGVREKLRNSALTMTRAARVPQLERVSVLVVYDPPPDWRDRDPDNIAASVKPLIDALRPPKTVKVGSRHVKVTSRAGYVLADDDSRHVAWVTCMIGDRPVPLGRLRMIITDQSDLECAAAGGER